MIKTSDTGISYPSRPPSAGRMGLPKNVQRETSMPQRTPRADSHWAVRGHVREGRSRRPSKLCKLGGSLLVHVSLRPASGGACEPGRGSDRAAAESQFQLGGREQTLDEQRACPDRDSRRAQCRCQRSPSGVAAGDWRPAVQWMSGTTSRWGPDAAASLVDEWLVGGRGRANLPVCIIAASWAFGIGAVQELDHADSSCCHVTQTSTPSANRPRSPRRKPTCLLRPVEPVTWKLGGATAAG
jgi:hypothetical protein